MRLARMAYQVTDLFNPTDTLSLHANADAVSDFWEWRKKRKFPVTDRVARTIAGHLMEITREGGNATEALDMAMEQGWRTIKPDWYWRQKNGNGNRKGGGHAGSGACGNDARERALRIGSIPAKPDFDLF